jgi:hypothetical protein
MITEDPAGQGSFELTTWGSDGTAYFEAVGSNRRSALEAALQAAMTLLAGPPQVAADVTLQSAPIRGEGDDLGALLTDLLTDLVDQCSYFGAGWQDVSLDGIVRREDGGLVAWGYLSGSPRNVASAHAVQLRASPAVDEADPRRVIIRAALIREESA